jgi:hypothetical protein
MEGDTVHTMAVRALPPAPFIHSFIQSFILSFIHSFNINIEYQNKCHLDTSIGSRPRLDYMERCANEARKGSPSDVIQKRTLKRIIISISTLLFIIVAVDVDVFP